MPESMFWKLGYLASWKYDCWECTGKNNLEDVKHIKRCKKTGEMANRTDFGVWGMMKIRYSSWINVWNVNGVQ